MKNMGEAIKWSFMIQKICLIVYENKQNDNAAFDKKIDGEVVDNNRCILFK